MCIFTENYVKMNLTLSLLLVGFLWATDSANAQHSVSVVPSALQYNETSTNLTGNLTVILSQPYLEDVWVQLSTVPSQQSNLVFQTTNAVRIVATTTSSPTIDFSVPDGTLDSAVYGIEIVPAVTNAGAAGLYTDLQSAVVFVSNLCPSVASPTAGAVIGPIPATVPYTFNYTVKDVPTDLSSMIVRWRFSEGGPLVTVTGAVGSVSHTYMAQGTNTVWMQAEDKDGGFSPEIAFTVTVGPTPAVMIFPPFGPLVETPNMGEKDFIVVQLTSAFTNAVTVNLAVTPANSAYNGTLTLETNRVVFPPGVLGQSQEKKVYISSVKDGTQASSINGFTITPTVTATPAAIDFYAGHLMSGEVRILNVAPEIVMPVASTNVAYSIPQGIDWSFFWSITDVMKDWTNGGVTTTWYWGDGTTTVAYTLGGRSGSVTHNYWATGDMVIRVVAMDKDGAFSEVQFTVRVLPSKFVHVAPLGPVSGTAYAGAAGLGNGLIFSAEARTRFIEQDIYEFMYDFSTPSATLMAVPYKTSPVTGTYRLTNYLARVSGIPGQNAFGTPDGYKMYDSFFYVWRGAGQGLPGSALNPATASPSVAITLAEEDRSVEAVFSREWCPPDNVGDINSDGIPDPLAILYGFPTLLGNDLASANDYNADLDFLPGAAGGDGLLSGTTNTWAAVGSPFTAFLEIRGFHTGLNNTQFGSDPDFGPGEMEVYTDYGMSAERPTDPTKLDTDGDEFPDGWEYYFWYNALVNQLTGLRYNPSDVAAGLLIGWPDIYSTYDPLTPATDSGTRDLDNDGVLDLEELAAGTNPIRWDTDGDGLSDGWEISHGFNPNDASDARPVFTPASGFTATNSLIVRIATADGAEIRYTLDGSLPTSSSTLYQADSPITLTQSATVQAKAFRTGMLESAAAVATYTLIQTVALPVLTPADGTRFTTLRKVTMSCATAGVEIRYTLDGTEPTRESLLYTQAFNIAQTTTFKVKAFKGDIAESDTVTATYYRLALLNEAVDATNLLVATGGDASWFAQTTETHDGIDAAQSGTVTHNQSTWMETSVTGPGTLSFWWRTSCEDDPDADNWDYVNFAVDGIERHRLDGIMAWQQVALTLGSGTHTLRWTYKKDESLDGGADGAWVDQLSFMPGVPTATGTTPVPVPYAWLDQYPALLELAGGDYEAAALADMDGDGHVGWQEYVSGSNPTNRESVLRSLISTNKDTRWIAWTPDLGTARVYSVVGRTNLTDAVWGPTNAGSRFFRVNVDMP